MLNSQQFQWPWHVSSQNCDLLNYYLKVLVSVNSIMLTLSTSLCLNFTAMYNVATTLFCYRFLKPLFSNDSNIYWNEEFRKRPYSFVATTENDDFPTGYSFVPDVDNATNIEIACSGLTKPDCMRWISCSRAAKDCCQRHVASHRSAPEYYCEATWDGVSCLDSTPNGTDVAVKCPSFYIPLEGPGKFSTSNTFYKIVMT